MHIKEINEMFEYFQNPIECNFYLKKLDFKYKNFEDALNNTYASIDEKWKLIEEK